MGSVIEIRLTRVEQLFNSLDPSSFHERDLDPAAEAHIVGWAREMPRNAAISINIHLPDDQLSRAVSSQLPEALCNYFSYRALAVKQEFNELLRVGWRYLCIGLVVLVACLMGSQFAEAQLGTGAAGRLVSESLIILGWVANWRPIETFLYDWLPIRRHLKLLRRLSDATVLLSRADLQTGRNHGFSDTFGG